MVTSMGIGELTRLKHIAEDVVKARQELEANLTEIQRRLADPANTLQPQQQDQAAQDSRVDDLERQLKNIRRQLERTRTERNDARRELSRLRDDVQRAMHGTIVEIYGVIGRRNPYQQIEELQQANSEAYSENDQLKALVHQLEGRVGEITTSLEERSNTLHVLEEQTKRLEGLNDRYRDEKSRHAEQLQTAGREGQYATLRGLISQVTPRRLAELIDGTGQVVEANSGAETVLTRLADYLESIGLKIAYRLDEQVSISEANLHWFQINEEFKPGSLFQVTAPGFALGEDVLVKARVRYIPMEAGNGSESTGYDGVGEELRESGQSVEESRGTDIVADTTS